MSAPLELRVTRFERDGSWDWRLSDGRGRFLADCEARLAAEPRRLEALRDLPAYLERRRGAFPVEHDLAELGAISPASPVATSSPGRKPRRPSPSWRRTAGA